MLFPCKLLLLLSVIFTCLAQKYAGYNSTLHPSTLTTPSRVAPIADIRLLAPKGSECKAVEDSYDAITLRVWSNFTRQCHNLNALFDPSERQSSCPNNTCPGGVMPLQLDNWDSTSNFSRIYFSVFQPGSPFGPDEYDPSRVTMRAYAGENCTDRVGVPWFQWGNCNVTESDVCKEVGYDVVSVLVTPTDDVEESDRCLIAAFRGAGVKAKSICFGSVVAGVLAFVMVSLF